MEEKHISSKEEKYIGSKLKEDQKVGKKEETYSQSVPTDKVRLVFKGTRTFELHIGRKIYRFEGREPKYVPKSVLDHKDFTEQTRKYFVIGE